MQISIDSLLSIALGLGLAAAAGFRAFLPLLAAAAAARLGVLPLSENFAWLASDAALATLTAATVIEVLAYYIPGLDHLLDLLAGPISIAAGVLASASVMIDLPPSVSWPIALILGGGVAGLTKGGAALIRAQSGATTFGLGNPAVSTAENVGAAGLSVLAIALPLLCLLLVAVLLFWAVRAGRRLLARRRA